MLFYFPFLLCHLILKKLIAKHIKSKWVWVWKNPPWSEKPVESIIYPTEISELRFSLFRNWNFLLYNLLQFTFKLKGICMSFITIVIVHITIKIPFCPLRFLLSVCFVATAAVTCNIWPSMVSTSGSTTKPTASRGKKVQNQCQPPKLENIDNKQMWQQNKSAGLLTYVQVCNEIVSNFKSFKIRFFFLFFWVNLLI